MPGHPRSPPDVRLPVFDHGAMGLDGIFGDPAILQAWQSRA